jgi:hypothetical protein
LVEGVFLAGHATFFLLGFAFFGEDGLFGLSIVFDFGVVVSGVHCYFFVDDGAEEVRFLGRLGGTYFFQIVEVGRIFHQLIQQF